MSSAYLHNVYFIHTKFILLATANPDLNVFVLQEMLVPALVECHFLHSEQMDLGSDCQQNFDRIVTLQIDCLHWLWHLGLCFLCRFPLLSQIFWKNKGTVGINNDNQIKYLHTNTVKF